MDNRNRGSVMGGVLVAMGAAVGGILFSASLQAACTAANPNANVAEATPTTAFTDNGNGTVTHQLTGLTWDRCSVGQTWGGVTCSGTATVMTWASALSAAVTANAGNHLGYSDWRLPSVRELGSIAEPCGWGPSINQTLFPATPSSHFWSSTSSWSNAAHAWLVIFSDGGIVPTFKSNSHYARLVRGGQVFDTFDALAPNLSGVAVSGTTSSATTLAATANIDATGYWLLVAQGSAAPTSAEVKAGVNYGAVTVLASGIGSMSANIEATFAIAGLTEATAYDLYLVGHDSINNTLTPVPSMVSFTTQNVLTPFAFTDQLGVALSTLVTSDTITVSGLNLPAQMSVSGGEYSLNGGAYTTVAGTVSNGDTVTVLHTSAASGNTTTDTVLTIGGVSDIFSSTTVHDTTPDAFLFTDQVDVAVSTLISSDTVTVSGITTGVAITVTGGEYSINAGAFTTLAGTVNAGDTVTVRHTSAAFSGTATDTVLTIGGVSDTFSTTTVHDTTPDAFLFTDQVDVALSTLITSDTITVSGITTGVAISVTGGEYSINGGTYTAVAGTVNAGDTVTVRHTSAAGYDSLTDTVLTIGGVSDTFSTTTMLDTIPDAFLFTDQVDVALNTMITSNTITVTGIAAGAAISVSGGEYSINGGSFTTVNGMVNVGDTVMVRGISSPSGLTAVDVVLDINGVSDTFTLTTEVDTDGDGIGNSADDDDDGDGVPDIDDVFPLNPKEYLDSDGDGIGNNADSDDDNDGVPDTQDAFPLDPTRSAQPSTDQGGGGAFGFWSLFALLGLGLWRRRES